MKIIDLSLTSSDKSKYNQLKARLTGISKYGMAWDVDRKAEETVIAVLSRVLDNKHHLIRHVAIPGSEKPVSLVLVGPEGIYVILPSGVSGIFRAKNELWLEMNRRSRKYQPVSANPIARLLKMVRQVNELLASKNITHPELQPALLFTDAGAHVDAVRPAVRVVLKDGIERYGISLAQADITIKPAAVQDIVDALYKAPVAEVTPEPEEEIEAQPGKVVRTPAGPSVTDKAYDQVQKLGWRKRQWWLLAGLIGILLLLWMVLFALVWPSF